MFTWLAGLTVSRCQVCAVLVTCCYIHPCNDVTKLSSGGWGYSRGVCVCVCVCVCVRACVHACVYMFVRGYMDVVCMRTYVGMFVCVRASVRACARTYVCVCVCVCCRGY